MGKNEASKNSNTKSNFIMHKSPRDIFNFSVTPKHDQSVNNEKYLLAKK